MKLEIKITNDETEEAISQNIEIDILQDESQPINHDTIFDWKKPTINF